MNNNLPLIVAITGASGVVYGLKLLQALKKFNIKSILILSNHALTTIKYELKLNYKDIISLADEYYNNSDLGASIASGSVLTRGMVVVPCSVKTLSAISNCYSNTLISRASDVCLKERRKLVLLFRETPFHLGHIKLMEKVTLAGAIVMPPLPSFYNYPNTIDDLINTSVSKILDLFNIYNNLAPRWS